mmetsp:Transcript_6940/g.14375  ORF Transcript_6940/g.14375 Transcript_6940/m.14375 type:complete len:206 (+) Transcript_6940:4108-4725(+)
MDLKNPGPGCFIGDGKLDLAIDSSGSEKGRVENVNSVGCGNDLDSVIRGESVKLIEQFEHGSLNFTITTLVGSKSLGPNGIQFINENDSRGFFSGECERVSNKFCAITDKHLNKLGTSQLEECSVGLGSACPCQQSLAHSGRPVHEYTLRRFDSDLVEPLFVRHGQNHCLDKFFDLLIQAPDISVVFLGLLIDFHRFDPRIVFIR